MSLHLNGDKVPGHAQKFSIDLKFPSEDTSGNGSSTAKSDKGDKGKTFKVKLSIKYVDDGDLSRLVNMAEAKDGNGERVIYNIVNLTANAANMRQGFFDESFSVSEDETTERWNINFSMSEHQSVPEKKEARKAEKPVTEQPAKGAPVNGAAAGASTPAAVTTQAVELTTTEQKLKWLNDHLPS